MIPYLPDDWELYLWKEEHSQIKLELATCSRENLETWFFEWNIRDGVNRSRVRLDDKAWEDLKSLCDKNAERDQP